MFNLDRWQEIFSTMKSNLLRTFLTAVAVGWGIFMLVLLMGAGNGFEDGVRKSFASDASTKMVVRLNETSKEYNGYEPGRNIELKNKDVAQFSEIFESEVNNVSGKFNMWMNSTVAYKDKSENLILYGVDPNFQKVEFVELLEGRFVNLYDQKKQRKVAVIGDKVQEVLFDTVNPIGQEIEVNNVSFVIVGVFKQKMMQGDRGKIYLPLATGQMLFLGSDRIDQMLFSTKYNDLKASKKFQNEVLAYFSKSKHFDPKDERAISIENSVEQGETFNSIFLAINIFVWFIGGVTLLAGIIGVGNIMLVVVKERTKEIGIRKAIGATPRSIILQIFHEAILITTFSGYCGLLLGMGVLSLLNKVVSAAEIPMIGNIHIDLTTAMSATVILVVLGALAGLMPAIKAARIKPIEALRYE